MHLLPGTCGTLSVAIAFLECIWRTLRGRLGATWSKAKMAQDSGFPTFGWSSTRRPTCRTGFHSSEMGFACQRRPTPRAVLATAHADWPSSRQIAASSGSLMTIESVSFTTTRTFISGPLNQRTKTMPSGMLRLLHLSLLTTKALLGHSRTRAIQSHRQTKDACRSFG